MIVQDKENRLDYYGAVQFHTDGERMSLAKYPGVKMKYHHYSSSMEQWGKEHGWRPDDLFRKDFYYGDMFLNDGDWLVTDKEGKTEVYTNEEFKRMFSKEEGVES